MDCKRALQETNGDMEAATVILREKGMAQVAKRAGRATTEARSATACDDGSKDDGRSRMQTEPVSGNKEISSPVREEGARRRGQGVGGESELEGTGRPFSEARREHRRRRWRALSRRRREDRRHPPAGSSALLQMRRRRSRAWCHAHRVDEASVHRTGRAVRARCKCARFANSDEVQSKPEQAREDRRRDAQQAVLRGDILVTGVDLRLLEDRRPNAEGSRRRGARVRALHPGRMSGRRLDGARKGAEVPARAAPERV